MSFKAQAHDLMLSHWLEFTRFLLQTQQFLHQGQERHSFHAAAHGESLMASVDHNFALGF